MTQRPATLVLMGLRGSGKTTLGRLVSLRTGAEFVDLDALATGLLGEGTLAELWARYGEDRFREAELRALEGLDLPLGSPRPRVVALGGGAPTAPGAARLLREATAAGEVALVYLRAAPGTLLARLAATDCSDRPSLTGAGTLGEIGAVFAARDPLYRELATRIVEVEGRGADDLAAELSTLIGTPRPRHEPPGRTPGPFPGP